MDKDIKKIPDHIAAFDYYYSLGEDRSYAKVAEKFNRKLNNISRWANKYSWQRRVAENDHRIAMKLQRETDKQILEDRKTYRTIIKASVDTYLKNLKAGKISVDRIKDLRSLIETDLKLMEILDKGTANNLGDIINMSGESMDTINRLTDELNNVSEPPDLEDD